MDQILSPQPAQTLLMEKIKSLEESGFFSIYGEDMMLGALTARMADGSLHTVYAFSGSLKGRYIIDGFTPPCFSNRAFEEIVDRYNSSIHCYTDRIEQGEKGLEAIRAQLSRDCLAEIMNNYSFHTPSGSITFKEMNLASVPTGTGDCAAAKLLSWCFRRHWEPVSLCEIYYGHNGGKREHLTAYNPCDEKCGLIFPHLFGLEILYGDDDITVISKPSGLLSVPGKGEDKADCATARFRKIFPSAPQNPSVHRLDMDTSGILVLAKNAKAQREISRQFEARETEKSYVALVDGLIKEEEGVIDLPMRLDVDNRPHQIVDTEYGKKAVTEWKRLSVEITGGRTVTRVRFKPLTGRTHQIRVHAASGLGHPVLGDRLYGDEHSADRLCLHAQSLTITHPSTGERMTFSSAVPF